MVKQNNRARVSWYFRFKSLSLIGLIFAFVIGQFAPQVASAATTHTAGRTTTSGAAMYTGQQNIMSATQVRTGAAAGTLSTVSVYVGVVHAAPLNHMQVALYSDTGANMPGNRIAQSTTQTLQPHSWNTFAVSNSPIAANTAYWLVFNVDGSNTQVPSAAVTGGRSTWKHPVSFGSWPVAYGSPSLAIQPRQYSIYLTYSSNDVPPQPPVGGSPGCGLPVTTGAVTRTLTVNGQQRSYLVVTPAGLEANTPTPVVMGFHGGSGTSSYARQTYGLENGAAAIYVYPQAPYWPEAGGVAWNVDPNGVDFPYFDAMLTDIKNKNCVEPSRVFAAGKSNGGFFVNALACSRPSDVRAIASVAGGGPQTNCTQPKPAMIVHGAADPVVPLATGQYSRDYWLAANQYAGAAPVAINPPPCVSYPGTINPVVWCQHTGGHDWPTWTGPAISSFFLAFPKL